MGQMGIGSFRIACNGLFFILSSSRAGTDKKIDQSPAQSILFPGNREYIFYRLEECDLEPNRLRISIIQYRQSISRVHNPERACSLF